MVGRTNHHFLGIVKYSRKLKVPFSRRLHVCTEVSYPGPLDPELCKVPPSQLYIYTREHFGQDHVKTGLPTRLQIRTMLHTK